MWAERKKAAERRDGYNPYLMVSYLFALKAGDI